MQPGVCDDCGMVGNMLNPVEHREEDGCWLCERCRERRDVARAEDNADAAAQEVRH